MLASVVIERSSDFMPLWASFQIPSAAASPLSRVQVNRLAARLSVTTVLFSVTFAVSVTVSLSSMSTCLICELTGLHFQSLLIFLRITIDSTVGLGAGHRKGRGNCSRVLSVMLLGVCVISDTLSITIALCLRLLQIVNSLSIPFLCISTYGTNCDYRSSQC